MQIEESLLPQALRIRISAPLSREARQRLRWMEIYEAHGRNARLTCRRFGISSATFYRWRKGYNSRRLSSLEDDRGTRRPRRVRQPQTSVLLEGRIRALREAYPRWGDRKLAVLLARKGWEVSASTVGRTLGRLRALGQLREAFPRFGFPVRAIQIDGGSEFKAVFEAACEGYLTPNEFLDRCQADHP